MKHIKPIQTFTDPQEALRHYLTMVMYFKNQNEKGLLQNIIWEVTLSSGSIHSEGHSVFINIIKDNFNNN
jgi:hypothetical protein